MDEWIAKRLNERAQVEAESKLIQQDGHVILQALLQAISNGVATYKALSGDHSLSLTETPERATISLQKGPVTYDRTASVQLSQDRTAIEVSGRRSLVFPLAIADGHAVLQHEGQRMTPDAAARLILEPLLFPEATPAKDESPLNS